MQLSNQQVGQAAQSQLADDVALIKFGKGQQLGITEPGELALDPLDQLAQLIEACDRTVQVEDLVDALSKSCQEPGH